MRISTRTKLFLTILGGALALLYLTDFEKYPLDATLDKSWMAVIGWAAAKRLQFGIDIVYTYGPLGYLISPLNTPHIYWRALGVRFIFDILFLAVLFGLSCRLRTIRRICFLLGALLVARQNPQVVLTLMIVAAAWFVFICDRPNPILQTIGFLLLGTALAVKGTFLFLTLAAVLVGLFYLVWRRNLGRAVLALTGFMIAFLAAWTLAGQRLSSIPTYLTGSYELARGYNEVMNIWPSSLMLAVGLTGYVMANLQILITLIRHRSNFGAWCVSAVLGLALFETWKLGFTRADGHVTHFFFYLVIAILALPAFYTEWPEPMPRLLEPLCAVVVAGCGLFGIYTKKSLTISRICEDAGHRIWANLVALTDPKEAYARFRAIYENESRQLALPLIRDAVGSSTVDVFGHEQAVAITNELNYSPRPVIQGFAVVTAPLVKLNGAFYRSNRAPDYVIFKLQAIDGHAPPMDDAEALLVLAQDYHPVLEEKGYTLLKRNENAPSQFHLKTTYSQQGALDQWIRIPKNTSWCELHVQRTSLGKLMTFFFQLPPIWFEVEGSTGHKSRYRLVFEPAAHGFIISPILRNERDLLDFASDSRKGEITRAVRVRSVNSRWFIRPHASYAFAEIVTEKVTETSTPAP